MNNTVKNNELTLFDKYSILKEKFSFLDNDKEPVPKSESKEDKFLQEYNSKLYREFCICDLSLYKKGKIGLRWCFESDILKGKGYTICGNISCERTKHLKPFEVNMKYKEHNETKNALVKVYLCRHCGKKIKKYKSNLENK